jgi:hypothetical protein
MLALLSSEGVPGKQDGKRTESERQLQVVQTRVARRPDRGSEVQVTVLVQDLISQICPVQTKTSPTARTCWLFSSSLKTRRKRSTGSEFPRQLQVVQTRVARRPDRGSEVQVTELVQDRNILDAKVLEGVGGRVVGVEGHLPPQLTKAELRRRAWQERQAVSHRHRPLDANPSSRPEHLGC